MTCLANPWQKELNSRARPESSAKPDVDLPASVAPCQLFLLAWLSHGCVGWKEWWLCGENLRNGNKKKEKRRSLARSTRGVPTYRVLDTDYSTIQKAAASLHAKSTQLGPPSRKAPRAHPIGIEKIASAHCFRWAETQRQQHRHHTQTQRHSHTPTFLLQLQGSLSHCFIMLLCSFCTMPPYRTCLLYCTPCAEPSWLLACIDKSRPGPPSSHGIYHLHHTCCCLRYSTGAFHTSTHTHT